MSVPESSLSRAARWLAFASAVSMIISIAASEALLGLALATLLLSGEKLQWPRIKLPLALFLLGTVISWLLSGELAAGLPQIRKFFVFCDLLVVFSCLRDAKIIRWLFLSWAGLGTLTAVRGMIQFVDKVQQAHASGQSFYDYYVGERITGFASHWNTFSAEEMFCLIMLAAFLFFGPRLRARLWVWILCAASMSLAVLLGETRGIWIATAGAALYLVWFWNRKLVLVVPVIVGFAFLLAPHDIRERFQSIIHPRDIDSNAFRVVTWRTGIEMIERHPWLGLGPEGVKYHFREYIPADIRRPLPPGFYEHLHNIYLQYAAERGIPTMLMMMWMLIQILVDFYRGVRALPPGRDLRRFLLQGGIAVVLATMIEGVVEHNLGDSHVLAMFLIVVACGYLALEKDIAFD